MLLYFVLLHQVCATESKNVWAADGHIESAPHIKKVKEFLENPYSLFKPKCIVNPRPVPPSKPDGKAMLV